MSNGTGYGADEPPERTPSPPAEEGKRAELRTEWPLTTCRGQVWADRTGATTLAERGQIDSWPLAKQDEHDTARTVIRLATVATLLMAAQMHNARCTRSNSSTWLEVLQRRLARLAVLPVLLAFAADLRLFVSRV